MQRRFEDSDRPTGVTGGRRGRMDDMASVVRLRPVEQEDLSRLVLFNCDAEAAGEWLWVGYRMDQVRQTERRWAEDGLIGGDQSYLAVVADGQLAGWVTWLPVTRSSGAIEVGIALFPEYRGRGIGTDAQRQLIDYLFATTMTIRLQALTEVSNVAEQKALEKAGFLREGVMRGLIFRNGAWRDSVVYGLVRSDL